MTPSVAIYVGVDAKGSHRCYRSENGITREWVGPPFAEPKDAIAYAAKLRGVPATTPVPATRTDQLHSQVEPVDGAGLSGSPEQVAGPGVPEPALDLGL